MKQLSTLLKQLPPDKPHFVEPMQCKLVNELPSGKGWIYELKFDGYRAQAIKNRKEVSLISRNAKNLNRRYPELVSEIKEFPVQSFVLDGEIVVLDERGVPSFQRLQDLSATDRDRSLYYYAFDLLNIEGKKVSHLTVVERKGLLQAILSTDGLVRYASHLDADGDRFVEEVRKLGLEGVVAKRKNSLYEPGRRSGSWVKYKLDTEQEFVVGGFRPSGVRDGFDLLLIGYYEGKDLRYAAKLRAGFTPHSKRQISSLFPKLITKEAPFSELPVGKGGRWGEGLTMEDLKKCIWLKPEIVIRAQFVEWTSNDNLRHAKFVALRDDKNPRDVMRET